MNPEIEKAIDELIFATHHVERALDSIYSLEYYKECNQILSEARTKLIELIKKEVKE